MSNEEPLSPVVLAPSNGKTRPPDTRTAKAPVTVIIPTLNEAINLPRCLDHLRWADEVVLVDSNSTDDTTRIAEAYGARVINFTWDGEWPKKRNWALRHADLKHEWILMVDADEWIVPELAGEIARAVQSDEYVGYWINRRFMFMGRWLKHCGYYPSWNLRLLKRGYGEFEKLTDLADTGSGDAEVHEHVIATGPVGYLKSDMLHFAFPNINAFVDKHNRYSNWEAAVQLEASHDHHDRHDFSGNPNVGARRRLKAFSRHLPFRPMQRFLYSYILQLGFLDGRAGFIFCRLLSIYEFLSVAKYYEHGAHGALAGGLPAIDFARTGSNIGQRRHGSIAAASPATKSNDHEHVPLARQRHTSPWTLKEKLGRVAWMVVARFLFRPSFHNWYGWRRMLLRRFGARIGAGVRVRPSVHIEIPWNLDIGDHVAVGDHAILYSLGKIEIRRLAVVSQYAHLCAGTHDYTDPTFPLLRPPITIGEEAWIAADAFVGPGVNVGARSVVGARSTVVKDVPAGHVVVGNPARFVKTRDAPG